MDGSILHIFTFQSSSENVNMWLLKSVDDYNCWDDTTKKMSTQQVLKCINEIAHSGYFMMIFRLVLKVVLWSSSPEESPQASPRMTLLFFTLGLM